MPADAVAIARDLVRCPSVTPEEGGALTLFARPVGESGICRSSRDVCGARHHADRESLRPHRHSRPNLVFAGHTDVVPAGDTKAGRIRCLPATSRKSCTDVAPST